MRITAALVSRMIVHAIVTLTLLAHGVSISALADERAAQPRRDFHVDSAVRYGLYQLRFASPRGAITVNLPADLCAGETVLGSVVSEPSGRGPEDRARNQSVLNTYAISLGASEIAVHFQALRWMVTIGSGGNPGEVILRDRQGVEAARAPLTVSTTVISGEQTIPRKYLGPIRLQIPTHGQADRPLILRGPMLDEHIPLHVMIGDKEAVLLAASPRRVIIMTPRDLYGKVTLGIRLGEMIVYDGAYRSDHIRRSFNPWPYVIGGAVVIGIGVAVIAATPIHLHLPPINLE